MSTADFGLHGCQHIYVDNTFHTTYILLYFYTVCALIVLDNSPSGYSNLIFYCPTEI